MKVSYNVKYLQSLSDKQLSKMFSDKSQPTLAQVYKAIGRELPEKPKSKSKEK